MSFFGMLKRAYGVIASASSGADGDEARIYDDFYLVRRSYGTVVASRKPIKRFLGEPESGRLLELLDGFLFRFDFECRPEKLVSYLRGRTHTYSSLFLSLVPVLLESLAIREIGRICENIRRGGSYSARHLSNALDMLRTGREIDSSLLFSLWKPQRILESTEQGFSDYDEATVASYRDGLYAYARKCGISEFLALLRIKKACGSLGAYIYRRRRHSAIYALSLALVFAALSAAALFTLRTPWALLLLGSLLGCSYTVCDLIFGLFTRPVPAPRYRMNHIPPEHTTLAVITALLNGSADDDALFTRIERFSLANRQSNLFFGILGDLPDSPSAKGKDDARTIAGAVRHIERLNEKYPGRFCLFIRDREESKADGVFRAAERKRGAVCALIRYLRGEDGLFSTVIADGERVRRSAYVLTLDADTDLPMDGVCSLLSVILHPVNAPKVENGKVVRGFGIIQPRMQTTLGSAHKTHFSSVTNGPAGLPLYQQASFDRYTFLFGNGVFCGKGLISVEVFEKCVLGRLPDGRILSHDMPEGIFASTLMATDITFTDSTPKSAVSYFRRLHRWIRGDTQNLTFLSSKDVPFSGKFKIISNFIGHLSMPLSAVALAAAALTGAASAPLMLLFCFLPYLLPAAFTLLRAAERMSVSRWGNFAVQFTRLALGTLKALFGSIISFAQNAFTAADAMIRSAFRLASGKKLLEWVTASHEERRRTGALSEYIREFLPGALFGALLVFFSRALLFRAAGFLFFVFPAVVWYQSRTGKKKASPSDAEKKAVISYARKIWSFFEDTVNESSAFLPIDNLQLSPTEEKAMRTSPTNIGLYLLSACAACDFGFIDTEKLRTLTEKTVGTVEKLEKYRGNLYNWYSLPDCRILGEPYVSSVDSGNFVTCLVAVAASLEAHSLFPLAARIRALADGADLSALYDVGKQLFLIGVNPQLRRQSPVCYDLLMSESRTMSYYAVATGTVDKKHWSTLSRYPIISGSRVGTASWSGTMFEYLMSQLLLPAPEGSFVSESIAFALTEQKKVLFSGVWGISESAFFSFDSEMTYQYKAHGIQSLSLKRYDSQPAVISPYSSFLALPFLPHAAAENLKKLSKLGCFGKYGFYEAIDFTPAYGGDGVSVCAFFSHHLGMSMIAAANAVFSGLFISRFMSDVRMQAGSELLEEQLPTEVPLRAFPVRRKERERRVPTRPENAAVTDDLISPRVCVLCRGPLTLIADSSGHIGMKRGQSFVNVCRFERYSLSRSLTVTFSDGERTLGISPLYSPRADGASFIFEQKDGSCAYVAYSKHLTATLKCSIHPSEDVFRFQLKCDGAGDTEALFSFVPMIERSGDFFAHVSFSKLFIDREYDDGNRLLLFGRRKRDGSEGLFCAVRLISGAPPECADAKDGSRCTLRIKLDRGQAETVLISVSKTRDEAVRAVLAAADGAPPQKNRMYDGPAVSALTDAVFYPRCSEQVYSPLGRQILWRFGISGDFTLITLLFAEENPALLKDCLLAFRNLSVRGIRMELLIITEEDDLYHRPREKAVWSLINSLSCNGFIGRRGGIFVFARSAFTDADIAYIRSHSGLFREIYSFLRPAEPTVRSLAMPETVTEPSENPEDTGVGTALLRSGSGCFTADGYTVLRGGTDRTPRSFVLCGRNAGTVLCDGSLGYTFVGNSRLCRITPFDTDPDIPPDGERILIFSGDKVYDACACAHTVRFFFGLAEYRGTAGGHAYVLEVLMCEKLPAKLMRIRFEDGAALRTALVIRPADENGCEPGRFISCRDAGGFVLFTAGVYAFAGCTGSAEYRFDLTGLVRGTDSGLCDVIAVTATGKCSEYFLGGTHRERACESIAAMLKGEGIFEREKQGALRFASSLIPDIRLSCKSLPLDLMFNSFLPYQAYACRFLARSAYFQSSGAYGFRDQLQDCLAVVYSDPAAVRTHLLRCAAHQYEQGDVMHWWHPYDGHGVRTRCSDDYLFLPFVAADYAKKTGDMAVFDVKVSYLVSEPLAEGEAERYEKAEKSALRESLYLHCMRALAHGESYGPHGLCKIGSCDWNDAFSQVGIKGRGESIPASFFYIMTLRAFRPIMLYFGDTQAAEHYSEVEARLLSALDEHAFCGDRYARAFCDDGTPVGVEGCGECETDLLAQSFAAMTLGKDSKAEKAMFTAYERLFDRKNSVFALFSPPCTPDGKRLGYINSYPPGVRENGGQYTHAAVWGAKAFFAIGRSDIALQLINALNPAARCRDGRAAAVYRAEPYVLAADISTAPGKEGRAGWTWYTGAASWYYKVILEDALGIILTDGFSVLSLHPHTEYTLKARFGNISLEITVSEGAKVTHNGEECSFPIKLAEGDNTVTAPPEQS